MIRVQEVKHYMNEPMLEEVTEEQAAGVEKKRKKSKKLQETRQKRRGEKAI